MQFGKEHLYSKTPWDFETTHFVMSKDGKKPTEWRAYPRKNFELIGAGGEAAIFEVDVQPAESTKCLFMVLKTYSMQTWYPPNLNGKPEIIDLFGTYDIETIQQAVECQLEGYKILLDANSKLAEVGLPLLNLPPTVRLTFTDLKQPAILMTNLTAGGNIMLEAKELLTPECETETLALKVSSVFQSFDDDQRKTLASQVITQISDQVERVKSVGVDFRQDHMISREYPHQFSSWSIIISTLTSPHLMIHDFSSVRRAGSGEDFKEMTSGLDMARKIWL